MKERVIFARNERLLDNEFPVTYDTLMRFKMHMKFIGLSERHRYRMIQRMRTFMGHYSKTSRQAFDEHSERLMMINHKQQPLVFDYVGSIKSLIKSFKKRCASYRKCGCRIKE